MDKIKGSFNCNSFFPKHKWSKWEVTTRGEIMRGSEGKVVGSVLIQERKCFLCGFREINKKEVRV